MIKRALQVMEEKRTGSSCGKKLNRIPIYTIHKGELQKDQSPKCGSSTNSTKCKKKKTFLWHWKRGKPLQQYLKSKKFKTKYWQV